MSKTETLAILEAGMLTIPGPGNFDAFCEWTRSETFPRRGRIDYVGGEIYIEMDEDDPFTIPAGVVSFEVFHNWTLSDAFPQRGRIDFIDGSIEVDMSPAAIQRHGLPKTRIGTFIDNHVQAHNLGQVFIDQTRVVQKIGNSYLSCEPDVLFASWKRIANGDIVFKPGKSARDGYDQMEVNGGPDLVVEVLSPRSIAKDTQRLKSAYYKAGVLEYWIVDALQNVPTLTVWKRGKNGFAATALDRDGFQRSTVLDIAVKLQCQNGPVPNTFMFNVLSK